MFDQNRENIYGAQEWAANCTPDQATDDLCKLYPSFGANVLSVRQHARERAPSWKPRWQQSRGARTGR